jgi:hypothetical protein
VEFDNHILVERLLTLHPPVDNNHALAMDDVRQRFIALGHIVVDRTPAGPDQTVAIRKLHEACMAAIAAIACNQEDNNART